LEARLVVLSADVKGMKDGENPAERAAKAILASHGGARRLYQNRLVFLAADKVRQQNLDKAHRGFLAWESILVEKETLNLEPHEVRQAETQRKSAEDAVSGRLPETYQWLLAPEQASPQAPVTWRATRVSGGDPLAVRASKRLRSDEALVLTLGGTIFRRHLGDVPPW